MKIQLHSLSGSSNIKSRAQSRLSCVYWSPRHSIKMLLPLEGSYAGVSPHCNFVRSVEVIFMVGKEDTTYRTVNCYLQYHFVRYARQTLKPSQRKQIFVYRSLDKPSVGEVVRSSCIISTALIIS